MNGWSFVIIGLILGGIGMTAAVGMAIVAMNGGDIPTPLASLATAVVGALAGHLGAMGYRLTNESKDHRGV
jgi:hypothetical protein